MTDLKTENIYLNILPDIFKHVIDQVLVSMYSYLEI